MKNWVEFTDIVGYTALMGKDSHKALELVASVRRSKSHWWKSIMDSGWKRWEMVP